jgi:hypothetical protein
MAIRDNLIRTIPAGEIVKPWIMLGAYNIDLSERLTGLTYFEQAGSATQVGISAIEEAAAAATPVLASLPREGEPGSFMGNPGIWNLVRGPERY